MIVIDAGSLIGAEAAPVRDVVRAFLDGLPPADRAGLLMLPLQAPQVDPTTDRELVRRTLARLVAVGSQLGGEFHLSESEIVDIMADASSILSSGRGRATGQAYSPGTEALQRVQTRECRVPGELRCVEAIVGEAAAFGQYLDQRASTILLGVKRMLDGLRQEQGRKTVVLISAGIAVGDRNGGQLSVSDESSRVATLAAYANATIYSLRLDLGLLRSYSPETRRLRESTSFSRDQAINARLLEQVARSSGGSPLLAEMDGGLDALARMLRETSAYYLLGVDRPSPLDGRAHRLVVKVSQANATVRHRQWVVLPKAGA